ncbi:MAG: hypothetical protein Q9211_000445 [Gyalolechia sp. 1 TL-2023]
MDIEEALRRLAAHTEKRKRENALAAGFVGLEEYEQHKLEERQQHEIREELSIKEDCLDKGITREQYDLEREEFLLEQIERHPKPKEHHILPPIQDCDCEHHPFAVFCPKSLVEYKSQDFPDMIEYLGNRHYIDSKKVKIKETDKSRRLDQELLEQNWIRRPLDGPIRDIPPWFMADDVVQQIIRQNACQDTSISPSPSPGRPPSLLYDSPVSVSPSADEAVTASMDTSVEIEGVDHTLNPPYPQEDHPSEFPARKSKGPAQTGSVKDVQRPRQRQQTGERTKAQGVRKLLGSLQWDCALVEFRSCMSLATTAGRQIIGVDLRSCLDASVLSYQAQINVNTAMSDYQGCLGKD